MDQTRDEPVDYEIKILGTICSEDYSIIIEEARPLSMSIQRLGLMRSYDDTMHQLENGHPASFRDLDDADEHHLVEVDAVRSDKPGRVWIVDRSLAFLKPLNFRCHRHDREKPYY